MGRNAYRKVNIRKCILCAIVLTTHLHVIPDYDILKVTEERACQDNPQVAGDATEAKRTQSAAHIGVVTRRTISGFIPFFVRRVFV